MYPILTERAKQAILDAQSAEPNADPNVALNVANRAVVGTSVTDHALYPPFPDDELAESWLESIITFHGIDKIHELWVD